MKEEKFFPSLGVFVPELWAFRQKDSPACRELLEDVAVLDAKESRILASRGKTFEAPLPQACWETLDQPRLIRKRGATILLFPIGEPCEKQRLALSLPWTAGVVSAALLSLGRSDFSGFSKPSGEDARLFSLLSELLFYLDRLLFPKKGLPLWTVILRSANFAGCKLKRGGLPSVNFQLAKEEIPLFFSFLICFFLSVRNAGKEAEIDLAHASPCYSVRFAALADGENPTPLPKTPFLDCEAFRRFSLLSIDDGHRLTLSLRRAGKEVSSGSRGLYTTLSLEFILQED